MPGIFAVPMDIGLFPAWTAVVGFFIGSAIGSFLNVVIYRLPRCMSIAEPTHSFCPRCKHQLGIPDLIPIFSWAMQGGKCRYCRAPIAPRYMVVELITGALWGGIWWIHLVQGADPVTFVAWSLFASALVAAIFTDLAHYIIPDEINAAMLIVGLIYSGVLIAQNRANAFTWGLPSGVAGALAGIGVLWGIAFLGRILFGKDAMGHGDIKMARGIGAVLFPSLAMISFGLAIVSGAVIGILVVIMRNFVAKKDEDEEEDEEGYEPESIGSLVKSLFGYVLLMDIVGLFIHPVYRWWFGEDPFTDEAISDDETQVELTMIPFGPHLAVGALAAMLFGTPLQAMVDAYWRNAFGG
ncbi:MAG: prepilin peptidase [Fimbriimonadaceae bacterium]|nr:prepilin peptidase [Fimbriimonadaceae bacterium]